MRTALAAIVLSIANLAGAQPYPKGWWAATTQEYKIGVDSEAVREGKPSAFIESIQPAPSTFIGLNQTFTAEEFRGKRVQLKGFLKSEGVQKWAGFWLRADAGKGKIVAFDNMQNRGLSGDSDWKEAEIVLDIPMDAETLYLGLILDGKGKVWMNSLTFKVVDASVPVTNAKSTALPNKPQNLDFTE